MSSLSDRVCAACRQAPGGPHQPPVYMDLASLGALPRYTCGQLYYYPAFHPRRDQVHCAPGCKPFVAYLPSPCTYHSCHTVQHHLAVKAGIGMANGPGCLYYRLPKSIK